MNTQTFSALVEPDRLDIVDLLAEKLKLNQPQTSKHLRVLSEAGLVEVQPIANPFLTGEVRKGIRQQWTRWT